MDQQIIKCELALGIGDSVDPAWSEVALKCAHHEFGGSVVNSARVQPVAETCQLDLLRFDLGITISGPESTEFYRRECVARHDANPPFG